MHAADLSLVPDALTDNRPVAVRRKRRASSALCNSPIKPGQQHSQQQEPSAAVAPDLKPSLRPAPAARTPRPKKRVRFSYPPDAATAEDLSATGITPFVARTRLVDGVASSPRPAALLHQPPRRRTSAPTPASSAGPDSLQLSSRNIEFHFTPLRQTLSERTRRRLARSHMSETMNDIEDEQKRHRAREQELAAVKQEVEQLRDQAPSVASDGRVRELEAEIRRLKEQLLEPENRSVSASAPNATEPLDGNSEADDESMLIHDGCDTPASSMPTTPATLASTMATTASAAGSPCGSAAAQTDLSGAALDKLHAHFSSQVDVLARARLELERILPGETVLPLSSPAEGIAFMHVDGPESGAAIEVAAKKTVLADAGPMLHEVLKHVRLMNCRIKQTTKDLSNSEMQRTNITNQFHVALLQRDSIREKLALSEAALLAQAQEKHAVQAQSQTAESRNITDDDVRACELEEATEQLRQLQEQAALDKRGRDNLVAALEKYRKEIKEMESLIGLMESEHAETLQGLKDANAAKVERLMAEHAQAVEDLEAQIVAATRGQSEAEDQIDSIMVRWADQRERGEREVGSLNVKLADMDEEVKERNQEVERLRKELTALQDRVRGVAGNFDGSPFVLGPVPRTPTDDPLLPENNSGLSRDGRRPPRVGKLGLLTPHVEGGRFRDITSDFGVELSSDASMGGEAIPGEVELRRGKRKHHDRHHDSGIGILMETDDE